MAPSGSIAPVFTVPAVPMTQNGRCPAARSAGSAGASEVAVLFSTSAGGTTWHAAGLGADGGAISPFATAFARQLAEGGTLEEMVARLRDEVGTAAVAAGYEQVPELLLVGGTALDLGL